MPAINRPTQLERKGEVWLGQFDAMASGCELLMAIDDELLAQELLQLSASEAWRIEEKYSRYRDDNVVARINSCAGNSLRLDAETSQLLDFAYQCYELTDGLFDITSGVLRQAWSFNPDSPPPLQETIDALLPFIGLEKAQWHSPEFTLPAGMQIDLGGIGKEYAVDRTLELLLRKSDAAMLVNFGGDMVCNRSPNADIPWRIGIDKNDQSNRVDELLELRSGALATSGSTQRYLIAAGKRYGHVLNPTTGWPIKELPLTVTVAAANCTQAGMLATFAMLQGSGAEAFLEEQDVQFWIVR
jgi:thiamine biosynthesis lipoprotein